MKKAISFLTAMAMLISVLCMGMTGFAAEGPVLEISGGEKFPGEDITITVSLKNNTTGFGGMAFDVTYDNNVLEVKESNPGIFTGSQIGAYEDKMNYQYAAAANTAAGDTTLVSLTFKIKENAPLGNSTVSVIPGEGTVFYYDGQEEKDIVLESANATVLVKGQSFENLAFTNDTVTYDGTAKALEVAGTLPQGAEVAYTSADFDEDGKAIDAGTYNIKATVTAPGYNKWEKEAVLTIEPKEVTVTGLVAANKTYDGTTAATISGGELSGKVEGDNLGVMEYPTAGVFEQADAGNNLEVTFADIVLDGEDKANYTLTQPTLSANIEKVAITVTGKKYAIKAGAELPDFAEAYEITSGALVGEDNFTGEVTTDADKDAEGTYKITQGTLTLGANYDLTFVDGEIVVSLKTPQNITVSEAPAKTYGDEGFTIEVTPDEASGLDTFTFTSSDENVATVTAEGVVTIVGAGEVTITVAQAGNEEYAAKEIPVAFTVAQKEVTVEAIDLDEKTATLVGVLEADLEAVEADFSKVALEIIPEEGEEPAEGEEPVVPTTATAKVTGLALKGDKAANYKLADAEIEAEVSLENVVTVEITATNGTVTGDGTYLIGADVTVTATADEGYNFSGWYVEDEKVSEDAEFGFIADESIALEAKFTKKPSQNVGGGGGGLSAGGDKSNAGADKLGNEDKEETTAPEETPVVTPSTPAGFADLGNHAWAADAIANLVNKGIIKGTSATTYSPAKNIIRADFVALVVRMFNLSSADTANFADVNASDYFAAELAIAKNNGIVGGIGDNKFAPRGNITRQDMMVMLYRAMQKLGIELNGTQAADVSDMDTVSEYAKEAVETLMANGIINGKNGKIDPMANATRAEVAVMLNRVLDLVK